MHIGLPTKFSYPLVFIQEGEKMENLISFYIFVFVIFSCLFYYYYYCYYYYYLLLLLFLLLLLLLLVFQILSFGLKKSLKALFEIGKF